jgi:hypothetical protein
MQLLPQIGMEENEVIADILLRSKMRIDNSGVCAREYNSIVQIIMECLVRWDFMAKKQGQPGIFGKVLGWSDTTEEQAKFTLHSHVLLFECTSLVPSAVLCSLSTWHTMYRWALGNGRWRLVPSAVGIRAYIYQLVHSKSKVI